MAYGTKKIYAESDPAAHKDNSVCRSKQINWRALGFRAVTPFFILITAIVLGYSAYVMVSGFEGLLAETRYISAYGRIGRVSNSRLTSNIEVISSLTSSLKSRCPTLDDWPNCSIPNSEFSNQMNPLARISQSRAMGYAPIVRPNQATGFEAFASKFHKSEGYPNAMNRSMTGIYARDEAGDMFHDINSLPRGSHDVLLPNLLATFVELNYKAIMLNIYSQSSTIAALDYVLDCVESDAYKAVSDSNMPADFDTGCFSLSDVMWLVQDDNIFRPAIIMYGPIHLANATGHPTAVGVAYSVISIDTFFSDSIPHYMHGIKVGVSVTQSYYEVHKQEPPPDKPLVRDLYVYEMKKNDAVFLGRGKRHIGRRSSAVRSHCVDLDVLGSNKKYTFKVYPTAEYDSQFQTDGPTYSSLFAAGIVIFTSIFFFWYDYWVTRSQLQKDAVMETRRTFVRFISHEVRTPLNTINLGLEVVIEEMGTALKKLRSSGRGRENDVDQEELERGICEWLQLLAEVKGSADSAVTVFSDLLNYDKIKNKTLQLELTHLSPIEIIEAAVQPFYVQARQACVTLTVTVHEDMALLVSNPERPVAVLGDAVKLSHVIRNLLSNALKFTPSGGCIVVTIAHSRACQSPCPKQTCTLLRRSEESLQNDEMAEYKAKLAKYTRAGTLVVTVADTGAGLTADNLRNLFREGVQFNANTLQGGGGSGLGLWISKGVMALHGGALTATSAGRGCGSTFRCEMPLISGELLDTEDIGHSMSRLQFDVEGGGAVLRNGGWMPSVGQLSIEIVPSPSGSVSAKELSLTRHTLRILIVDDAQSNRKLVGHILRSSGYYVDEAEDGQHCLDIMEQSSEPYDFIFMDFEMPRMDGPTATRHLRERGVTIPIIGITGNVLSDDISYFLGCGANKVLPKPLLKQTIYDALREHNAVVPE